METIKAKTAWISANLYCLHLVYTGYLDRDLALHVICGAAQQPTRHSPGCLAAWTLPGVHHLATVLPCGCLHLCAQIQQCNKHNLKLRSQSTDPQFPSQLYTCGEKTNLLSLVFHEKSSGAGKLCSTHHTRCAAWLTAMDMRQLRNKGGEERMGAVLTLKSQQWWRPWEVELKRTQVPTSCFSVPKGL